MRPFLGMEIRRGSDFLSLKPPPRFARFEPVKFLTRVILQVSTYMIESMLC